MVKVLIYFEKFFIFSAPVLIRHLWQLKVVVFSRKSLIHAVILLASTFGLSFKWILPFENVHPSSSDFKFIELD